MHFEKLEVEVEGGSVSRGSMIKWTVAQVVILRRKNAACPSVYAETQSVCTCCTMIVMEDERTRWEGDT